MKGALTTRLIPFTGGSADTWTTTSDLDVRTFHAVSVPHGMAGRADARLVPVHVVATSRRFALGILGWTYVTYVTEFVRWHPK